MSPEPSPGPPLQARSCGPKEAGALVDADGRWHNSEPEERAQSSCLGGTGTCTRLRSSIAEHDAPEAILPADGGDC